MNNLKIVLVSAVTILAAGYFGYAYLEPEGSRNIIPILTDKIRNTEIQDFQIPNLSIGQLRDKTNSAKNSPSQISEWTEYKNNNYGLAFQYPPIATDVIENNEEPYTVVLEFPETLATKVSRVFTVTMFEADFCEGDPELLAKTGTYIQKNYSGIPYAFRSEKLSSHDSVSRSFMAYTLGGSYCYLFDLRYSKAQEVSASDYNISSDFDDISDHLDFFERIMKTVQILK